MSKKLGDWWDESWNPIQGCEWISEACDNCWCQSYLCRFWNQEPGEIRYYPERIEKPYTWKKPRRVFCGSLTDLFQDEIVNKRPGFDILDSMLTVADITCRHTYIFLTKRPENVHDFLFDARRGAFNDNCWLGITAENQERLNERLPFLIEIPVTVRFLHLEPLLGPVDISAALPHVQWVVVGSEQGPGKRPPPEGGIESIVWQCKEAGVPVWVKQTPLGKDMNLWHPSIRFRELPGVHHEMP